MHFKEPCFHANLPFVNRYSAQTDNESKLSLYIDIIYQKGYYFLDTKKHYYAYSSISHSALFMINFKKAFKKKKICSDNYFTYIFKMKHFFNKKVS